MRSLLVTYDCECDKPSTKLVMAAGIFSLADVPADRRGNVRKNKVFSTFYLEENAAFEEAFADFRYAGLLEKAIVATRAETRLFSLGDAARLALQEQLSSFLVTGADGSTLGRTHNPTGCPPHMRRAFCCHGRQ
jgi:hypothetical protein